MDILCCLKSERVILQIAIEASTVQQPHDYPVRHPAHKHVVFHELGGPSMERKRMDLASDHWMIGPLFFDFSLGL